MQLSYDVTDQRTKNRFNSLEEEFNKVHDRKYDYSLVVYKDANTKITIICPEHGPFEQIANVHRRGGGCPQCATIAKADKRRGTTKQFIKNARKVHKKLYDYSKAVYTGIHDKIEIICRRHGSFWQDANDHISGKKGCPQCAVIKTHARLADKPHLLYYLKVGVRYTGETLYKIGVTSATVAERYKTGSYVTIDIIKTWQFDNGLDAYDKEQKLLKEHKEFKYVGVQVFNQGIGDTELFTKDVLGLDGEADG